MTSMVYGYDSKPGALAWIAATSHRRLSGWRPSAPWRTASRPGAAGAEDLACRQRGRDDRHQGDSRTSV